MTKPRLFAFLLLVLLGSRASLLAAEPAREPSVHTGATDLPRIAAAQLAPLTHAPALRTDDADAAFAAFLAAAREGGLAGELAVRMAAAIDADHLARPDAGVAVLQALLTAAKNQAGDSPWFLAQVRHLLARRLAARGESDAAQALQVARGIVPRWAVAGPFGNYSRADFYTPFPPEQGAADVSWRAIPGDDGTGVTHPWAWIHPESGVAYLQCRFTLAKPQDCVFQLTSSASLRLNLNGRELAVCDRLANNLPRELVVGPVSLPAGSYRLIVKCVAESSRDRTLSLRLLDPAGAPLPGLTWADPILKDDATPPPLAPITTPDARVAGVPLLRALRQQAATAEAAPETLAACAWLCENQDLADEALYLARTAARTAPDDPWIQHQHARTELAATHLTRSLREHDAIDAWRTLLERDPGFVPAQIGLAEYALSRERFDETLHHLNAALQASSVSIAAHSLRIRLALREEWENEARAWVLALRTVRPTAGETTRLGAAVAGLLRDKAGREKGLQGRWESRQHDAGAQLDWIDALIDLGRSEAALAALEAAQTNTALLPDQWNRIAELYMRLDATEAAQTACRRALALRPGDDRAWRRLGNLHTRGGNLEDALEAYRKSLAHRPEQHDLRRLIARLGGEPWAFWEEFSVDPFEELGNCQDMNVAGSTMRVIDQTVLEIYPDGSFSNFTHGLQKVLTRGGRDDAGLVHINGEILEARTIQSDSTYLEPVRIPGRQAFDMPGVQPGAAVEEKYVQSFPAPFDKSLRFAKWYFRSPSLEEVFVLSQYIIRVPKSYPFQYVARNMEPKIQFRTWEDDDWTVYQWTARRMPRASHEEGTPNVDELLPFVEIGGKRTWQDINHLLMNAYLGRLRPARNLREKATALTQGATTPAEQIERIFAFVCEEIEDLHTGAPASRILEQKAGDREILLMALLQQAGFQPIFAALRPPKTMLFEPNWELPQVGYFPLRIIMVPMPGAGMAWLDTRHRYLGPGQLLEDTAGATAFLVGPGHGEFVTLPPLPAKQFGRSETRLLRVEAASNTVAIQGALLIRGSEGEELKDSLALAPEREQRNTFESLMAQSIPGVTTRSLTYPDLTRRGAPLAVRYAIESETLLRRYESGQTALPLALVLPDLLPTEDNHPRERETPYHLDRVVAGHDEIRIALSPGAQLLATPQPLNIRNRFGYYHLRLSRDGEGIRVQRRFEFEPQRVELKSWPLYVEMARAIEAAEKQTILFRTVTTEDTSSP